MSNRVNVNHTYSVDGDLTRFIADGIEYYFQGNIPFEHFKKMFLSHSLDNHNNDEMLAKWVKTLKNNHAPKVKDE